MLQWRTSSRVSFAIFGLDAAGQRGLNIDRGEETDLAAELLAELHQPVGPRLLHVQGVGPGGDQGRHEGIDAAATMEDHVPTTGVNGGENLPIARCEELVEQLLVDEGAALRAPVVGEKEARRPGCQNDGATLRTAGF